ncbi:MAG: peptidylprolyl isomerase [Clostridia bacterium]|nr:peptidylprolyl isomerase [Clostridia bacterium]
MKIVKNIIWIVALILIIVLIAGLGYGYYRKITMEVKNPIATMEVENFGTVKMELYPEIAPETVSNFIALANKGFYDGLTFHRIVKDFMIQGGDKDGSGQGSAKISDLKDDGEDKEYSIKGEFISNGVDNTLEFDEGILGMARNDYTQYSSDLKEESYNSGSSQFFIVTKKTASLNGHYTSFGKVIEGLDVVHNIENVEVKAAEGSEETEGAEVSTPVNPPKITSLKVETYGVDYGLPETLTPFDYMSWLYKQYGVDPSNLTSSSEE